MPAKTITPGPVPSARSAPVRYGVAVAAVLAATALSFWLAPHTYTTPFLLFCPAVILAVWFGGFWPGILATVLSCVSVNYFMLPPHDAFNLDTISLVQTVGFGLIFATICWFVDVARQRLHSVIDVQSQLLEMSFDPVLVRDAEDRIIYWNKGAERLYGWSKDEALGRISHDLLRTVHPRPLDSIRAELNRTGHWHGELLHTRKDGSTVVVDSWWTLRKQGDKQSAILESNYDLSERKKAEESLRYLSAIVESSDAAIIGKTLDGIVTAWNPGAERLYGYSAAEMIGQPISRLNPEGHVNEFPSILQRLAQGERVESYDSLRRHKDGTLIDVALKVSPIIDVTGRIIGASSIARDIRNSKRMEEALRRSEQHVRHLLDSLFVFVGMMELDGTLIEANRAALVAAGIRADDVIGKKFWDCYWWNYSAHAQEQLQEAIDRARRGEMVRYDVPVRMKEGMMMIDFALTAMRDQQGNITHLIPSGVDISERKRAEQALVRNEKLATVGRMAATIAHEINNPLAAAMNALYLVSAGPGLPDNARGPLQLAEHELERVAHITKQTLGFYRESGSATEVRLQEVIDGILSLFAPKLKSRTLRVERRYRAAVSAFGVEGEIRQIVSNLIANSIDAMPENGTLHIRTWGPLCLDGARPMVRLTIADTGSGIAPDSVSHIFEPFYTTKAAIGTGLGLWVTKELVTKHEGKIRMRSQMGKGTVFTIWLPSERRHGERVGSIGAA